MKDDSFGNVKDLPIEVRSPDSAITNVKSIGQLINADENCHRQMARFEKDILVSAYQECVGNISKLAQRLGLDRSTL